MTRFAAFVAVWAAFFTLCIAYLVWLQFNGYQSSSLLALSGDAILAGEGRTDFAEMVTVYPPLPHLLSFAIAYVNAASAVPASVASALMGGLFAACVFSALRQSGTGIVSGLAVALLLTANPVFLRAVADGPQTVMLLCAMLMLAHGLFGLARDGTVQDVMAVALALVLLAFSSRYGVLVVLASLPFLALAAPRQLVAQAPGGLFLTLLFPIGFSLLAFAYVGWVFTGSAWAFLSRPEASIAAPSQGASVASAVLLAGVAIGLASPILPFLIARAIGREVLTTPAFALAGTILVAVALATASGADLSAIVMFSPVIAVAGACAIRWPSSRRRGTVGTTWTALGVIGGIAIALSVSNAADRAWRQASLGHARDTPDDFHGIAAFLKDRNDILVDAQSHPALVALRGTSRGLVVSGDPRFELALLTGQPTHRFVAMQAPGTDAVTRDRIGQAFPDLRNGAPGYRVVYNDGGWRVYETSPSDKDGN